MALLHAMRASCLKRPATRSVMQATCMARPMATFHSLNTATHGAQGSSSTLTGCSKAGVHLANTGVWAAASHRCIRGVRAGNMSVSALSTAADGAEPAFVVVYVTVPNQQVADSLSGSLVESQLAACVNVLPGVTSVYRWEGKVARDTELLLIIKTRTALLDQLTAHVSANHPYTVPEVISLPILAGSPAYLQWLADSTDQAKTQA